MDCASGSTRSEPPTTSNPVRCNTPPFFLVAGEERDTAEHLTILCSCLCVCVEMPRAVSVSVDDWSGAEFQMPFRWNVHYDRDVNHRGVHTHARGFPLPLLPASSPCLLHSLWVHCTPLFVILPVISSLTPKQQQQQQQQQQRKRWIGHVTMLVFTQCLSCDGSPPSTGQTFVVNSK